jgi:ATP-dependent DNA ligase
MLPTIIKPMLVQPAQAPFDSEHHLFEIKWDGIRCLAFVESGRVRLQSRQLAEISRQFPELLPLRRLPSGTVLDGELVAFRSGKPCLGEIQSRAQLQNRLRIDCLSSRSPASFLVFDLLFLRGQSVMSNPLIERRDALKALLYPLALPCVLVTEGIVGQGQRAFRQVVHQGMEGIVAKRLDSPYLPGRRSPAWRKLKVSALAGTSS